MISDSNMLVEAEAVSKSFSLPDRTLLPVLQDLSFAVRPGRIVAVTGASGSGKSTLLHLLGGLDNPDRGNIRFRGEDLRTFSPRRLAAYRNQKVGFVFQFHYLMPELTVLENVAFPSLLFSFQRKSAFRKALDLLDHVGLADKKDVMPGLLSGGERQRAAIARSLINSPDLILADEPTGNLDWKTGSLVFDVFRNTIVEREKTAVIVTHNQDLASEADQRFLLERGMLSER